MAEVWNTATPAGTDVIGQGDDRIREAKVALEAALQGQAAEGTEAIFPGTAPLTDPVYRYRGLIGTTAARPAAGQYGLYFNTTTGTIQRDNGSSWVDAIHLNPAVAAVHAAASTSLASSSGVVTLDETSNAFHVSGTEAVTSITGWTAGIVIVRFTQARTITHHASNLILAGAINATVAAGDIYVFQVTGSGTCREVCRSSVYGVSKLPTRQVLPSGTAATYTTPTGARQLRVRMVGAGGGGGTNASTTVTAASVGGDTSFNSIVATGGGAGESGVGAGCLYSGDGGTGGAGSASLRLQGGGGGGGSGAQSCGGGNSAFGGGATGNSGDDLAGVNAPANAGGGGSGGTYAGVSGGGGGSGEYVEYIIDNPAAGATYTYTVGAGGTGGVRTGGGSGGPGGAGGSGLIIVDEIY